MSFREPTRKKRKQVISTRERKGLRDAHEQELRALEKRIESETPPSGTNPLALTSDSSGDGAASSSSSSTSSNSVYMPAATTFEELPISKQTLIGLSSGNYTIMTDVQRATISHSLAGRDVLAAAKTGSGKTLAFLIPVIEKLYRAKWTNLDGLGALIISPTRELAYQIFEELRKVGSQHNISAGLVIGGKDLASEKSRICSMNILVCTPGRLLQHMDQTPLFDPTPLQILVLDEADRLLDMGFANTLNAIVENLPKKRQTLLFSATQTKSVKDLARLSLKDPEFISVHEEAPQMTPQNLSQSAIVLPLEEKINTLFSFLKTHTKSKILVFLSSCKQVRFTYEVFCKLQPGLPVMELHGGQKQIKRMAVYTRFCDSKHACLFATDIAARGLDFPGVEWVLQVDCPEDVACYVHRVGRTARYKKGGHALLFLLPSEQKMITLLQKSKVPINQIKVNPNQTFSIMLKLQSILSEDPSIKYLAQKSFISYLRSVKLQANNEVFDVKALPYEAYAASLGLINTPRVRFGPGKKKEKNVSYDMQNVLSTQGGEVVAQKDRLSKIEKVTSRKNATVLSDAYARLREEEDDEDAEDLLVPKKRSIALDSEEEEEEEDLKEQERERTRRERKGPVTVLQSAEPEDPSELKRKTEEYVKQVAEKLKDQDVKDKEKQRKLRREKRWEDKQRLREEAKAAAEEEYGAVAMLGSGGGNDDAYAAGEEAEENGEGASSEDQNEEEEEGEEEEEEEESEEERKEIRPSEKRGVKRKGLAASSTDDLEAMALSMLQRQ